MRLHALKFGLAVAIVAAILSLVVALFAAFSPYGMMGDGYMMRGGPAAGDYGHMYGPHLYRFGAGRFIVSLIVRPIAAGLAAWAVAVVYNRLLGTGEGGTTRSSD